MRTLNLAALFALLLACPAQPAHAAGGSFGAMLAVPEMGGLWGSFWPANTVSLDAQLTLASVDLGVTGHIPFAESGGRHSLLVHGIGGYVHDLVTTSWLPVRGWHAGAALGYGWLTDWDLRLLVGAQMAQGRTGQSFGVGMMAAVLFGRAF